MSSVALCCVCERERECGVCVCGVCGVCVVCVCVCVFVWFIADNTVLIQ